MLISSNCFMHVFSQVEKQELNEFELLEEAAAANCSLSSNSSTVLRILGERQQQHGADVNNNMLGVRQKWNVPTKGTANSANSVFIPQSGLGQKSSTNPSIITLLLSQHGSCGESQKRH